MKPDPMEAHQRPAERRMAEALAILDDWQFQGIRPRAEWRTPRIQVFDGENGPALQVPACLRMELLWLLRETQPIQRDAPGLRWLESGGGAA